MSDEDKKELDYLRKEFYNCSLGDRPQSPSAEKIRRLIELEKLEKLEYINIK